MAYTVEELCKELKISRAHAYRLIKANEIRHFKCGRLVRISEDAIQEYIQNHTIADREE